VLSLPSPEQIGQALAWIVGLLTRHGLPYQAVGGLAAQAYGARRPLVDIDLYVPLFQAQAALAEMQPYLVRAPLPHRSAAWDLVYLALEYGGVPIEIGDSAANPRFFNRREQCWEAQEIDYGASQTARLYGVDVAVMPRAELARYKAMLDREVDRLDLQDMAADDRIHLQPYDPEWPARFADEQRIIRAAVDPSVPLVIEHIGSTAIVGLEAKPILDLLVGAAPEHWPGIVAALKGLGYVHWEDNPDRDREFLVKGLPPYGTGRTHHVHLVEAGGPLWERVLFRDYLNAHPAERAAYAALKRRLAAAHPDDREAYTAGKSAFIAEVMARARAWRA
jgi:GrpB-like predicted nucleotidyltransferase (UPF0157 family)